MTQISVVVSSDRLMIQISVAVSCDRMMILGYKRDLQESDLWDLNPRDKSDTVVPTFERLWKAEVERCRYSSAYSYNTQWLAQSESTHFRKPS